MKSQVIKSIGHSSANALYKIGSSFNLHTLINHPKLDKHKIAKSDLSALESDWNSVGREVTSAIERFEREFVK